MAEVKGMKAYPMVIRQEYSYSSKLIKRKNGYRPSSPIKNDTQLESWFRASVTVLQ
ncbi:hypothetical protein [Sporomusa sp.]|uniref:hypothetical protein n=1 Tax=Sporomusa sp. TaxID=2078658 RepID=UPI002C27B1DD|nr:hypothetical protein [Sporomusa sp.]HWR42814.1 hypothetical protein [Sporomusa sp.]